MNTRELGQIVENLKHTLNQLDDERAMLANALEDIERYRKSIVNLERRVRDSVGILMVEVEK